jgi:hypothetical protein
MTERTLLSERVRPDVEAAPWVIDEIKSLELLVEELERDREELLQGVNPNIYCEICGSCGEEGCCPPEMCAIHKLRSGKFKLVPTKEGEYE